VDKGMEVGTSTCVMREGLSRRLEEEKNNKNAGGKVR
jgi:hypothetical protein